MSWRLNPISIRTPGDIVNTPERLGIENPLTIVLIFAQVTFKICGEGRPQLLIRTLSYDEILNRRLL